MPRYVAFLRAINVGGHVVKMDVLRREFEALDFGNVSTLIASGNVLFDSAARNTATLEQRIEQRLHESLGYEVATFLRTPAQLEAVSVYVPSASRLRGPAKTLYVGFLKAPPTRDAQTKLLGYQSDAEAFEIADREVYWSSTGGMGTSRVSGAQLEKTLKMPATFRNITTVRRLVDKE